MGVLLCFFAACTGLQSLTDRNPTAALGGGVIAIVFLLIGVPLLIYGAKGKKLDDDAARTRKCPSCAEYVRPDAKVCRYCQRDLPPLE